MQVREHEKKNYSNSMIAGYCILLIIAVLYSVMTLFTPLAIDDYMFMSIWKEQTSGFSFSLNDLADYYQYIRNTDNGRIANLFAPFTSLFSPFKELFPFLNGIMVAFLVFLTYKLECQQEGKINILFLIMTWGAIIVFLPWYNSILFANYALNYTWSASLTLGFIFYLFQSEQKAWSTPRFIICLILAFIAGGWHESFAIPTLSGITLYILSRKGKVSRYFYFICIVYLISAFAFMLSPGLIARFGFSVSEQHHPPSVRYYLVALVLLVLLACCILNKEGRHVLYKSLKSPTIITFFGVMVSGYSIGFLTVNNPRSYYWANLATIIIILYLLFKLNIFQERPKLTKICSVIILLLCIIQTIIVIKWQNSYYRENEIVISEIEKSPTGLVFYDFKMPINTPKYTLNIPTSAFWGHPWQYRVLSWYYKKPMLSIVPEELQNVKYEEGSKIPGDSIIKNVSGYYVTNYELLDPYEQLIIPGFKNIKIKLRNNKSVEKKILVSPFITNPYLHKEGENKRDTLLYLDLKEIDPNEIETVVSLENTPIEGFPLMYQKGRENKEK